MINPGLVELRWMNFDDDDDWPEVCVGFDDNGYWQFSSAMLPVGLVDTVKFTDAVIDHLENAVLTDWTEVGPLIDKLWAEARKEFEA